MARNKDQGFHSAAGLIRYFDQEDEKALKVPPFAVVALCIRYLSAQLRESGEGKEQLVAALEQTRLQAEDILRNIRSGVAPGPSEVPSEGRSVDRLAATSGEALGTADTWEARIHRESPRRSDGFLGRRGR